MTDTRVSLVLAIKEHLISGNPITQLESMVLFGVANVTPIISDMRRDGYKVESRRVPFLRVLRRVNEMASLEPPKNLPIQEISLTEYQWDG